MRLTASAASSSLAVPACEIGRGLRPARRSRPRPPRCASPLSSRSDELARLLGEALRDLVLAPLAARPRRGPRRASSRGPDRCPSRRTRHSRRRGARGARCRRRYRMRRAARRALRARAVLDRLPALSGRLRSTAGIWIERQALLLGDLGQRPGAGALILDGVVDVVDLGACALLREFALHLGRDLLEGPNRLGLDLGHAQEDRPETALRPDRSPRPPARAKAASATAGSSISAFVKVPSSRSLARDVPLGRDRVEGRRLP